MGTTPDHRAHAREDECAGSRRRERGDGLPCAALVGGEMTRDARPRGRWRPVLLSGLVLPGLGQLVTGHPWRALFFSAPSLALVAAVVGRVMRETQRLMPADPVALLDPMLPVTLAVEIHRANASFFFWATVGILVLWVGAIVDCIPRSGISPGSRGTDQSRHSSAPRRPGGEG